MEEILHFVSLSLASSIRLCVPLLFAALGGLISEKAGVFDISLEGKMLMSAFASAVGAYWFSSVWLGLACGVAASIALGGLHAYASVTHRGNQIISGVAINFIASGLTVLLATSWFHLGGRTPQLPDGARFMPIELPFAATIEELPVLGGFYATVLSGHNLLTYTAFISAFVLWCVMKWTRLGLRIRAVGENPAAVDTAGVSVEWLRYLAVILCSVFAGFAGAYLSIAQSSGFVREMSAGKGYIALAALVFANWRPINVLYACLLLGLLDAISIRLQGVSLGPLGALPYQLVQAAPFILTVVLLAGFVGRSIPPKAGGQPYTKGR